MNIDDKIKIIEKQLEEAKKEKAILEQAPATTISERVRKLMYGNNMTAFQLAVLAGCSASSMTRCINGERAFSLKTVRIISDVFKVSCDWLIKGEESSKKGSKIEETVLKATIKKLKDKIEGLEEELEEWKTRAYDLGYTEG